MDGFLRVTPSCAIALDELEWRVSTTGGPGGQHANRTLSRVDVSFRVDDSPSLGPRQRARLLERLGPVVRATAADTRSQSRNRELALERLRTRLADGLRVVPRRRPTQPSAAAREARLDTKRRRAQRKRERRRPAVDDG